MLPQSEQETLQAYHVMNYAGGTVATFHVKTQGNIGNQMIQFLVAKTLQKLVPDLAISNSVLPAWGINYPEIERKGRIFYFDEPQNVPFVVFRELFSRGLVECIQYGGYGQRVSNLPPWREATRYFRCTNELVKGFSSEHLVINIRGGEILDGRHPGYVLVPIDFYRRLVNRTGLKPVFMGQIDDNVYCDALRRAFPDAPFIPSGGMMHDFELVRRSVNVVPAVSTFSWLACWLSETAENIFMPMTGIFNPFQSRDHDFAPTNDERFKFFWFPANYAGQVGDFESNHAPLQGRFRQIDDVELRRMKAEDKQRPKRLDDYAPHFDEAFYRMRYPDVSRSLTSGLGSGFEHYIGWGFKENRQPMDFDPHRYVQAYPDAASEIGLGIYEDPIHHYVSVGASRGYRPIPTWEALSLPVHFGGESSLSLKGSATKARPAGQIHRIRTFHGTVLVANLNNGQIEHGSADAEGCTPVFGYRPASDAPFLFLAADLPANRLLSVRGQEAVSRLVPVHTTRTAQDGSVACYAVEHGRFLLGEPPPPDKAVKPMEFGSVVPDDFERIYLDAMRHDEAPAHLWDAVPLIDHWVAEGCGASAVHSLLSITADDATLRDVVNAVGLLLSSKQWEDLGEKLVSAEGTVAMIEARFPGDIFAQHALRPAAERVRAQRSRLRGIPAATSDISRFGTSGRQLDTEFDKLDRLGVRGEYVSFPASCTVMVRRAARPRRRAAVLATACNEGLYILDWLAHHRAVGFDDFFIYTNDNIDQSDALLEALAQAGEIHWIKSVVQAGTRPQWKVYRHALAFESAILEYDWTLAIDLDEYFELNDEYFRSIGEYLDFAECRPVDAIALNWVMVGSNGQGRWASQPLRKRFPLGELRGRHGGSASELVKTIFRTTRFPMSFPHHPVPYRSEEPIFRTSTMRPFPYDRGQGASYSPEKNVRLAWISHFFFKSNEEFVFKFSRQRGDDQAAAGSAFAALTPHFIRSFVEASSLRQVHPTDGIDIASEEWRARYERLPGVQGALQRINAFYAGRLAQLLPTLRSCSAIREAGEAGEVFLRPLLVRSSQ
jgi:hypothetical protein